MASTSAVRSARVGQVADRRRLGRQVDRRRLDARRLAQEALDPVDAGRAGHALDRQGQLEWSASLFILPGSIPSAGLCETRAMPDSAVIRTTIPGPWGPFHLRRHRPRRRRVAWLTTEPASTPSWRGASTSRSRTRATSDRTIRGGSSSMRGLARSRACSPGADPPRRRRSTCATGRPGTGASSRPWRRSRWGRTASYGEIARQIGAPRAARAVGGAVGRNPISLLIPCHRVIAADGTLGGYGGDGWGEPRGAPGDEARPAPARRRHASPPRDR